MACTLTLLFLIHSPRENVARASVKLLHLMSVAGFTGLPEFTGCASTPELKPCIHVGMYRDVCARGFLVGLLTAYGLDLGGDCRRRKALKAHHPSQGLGGFMVLQTHWAIPEPQ